MGRRALIRNGAGHEAAALALHSGWIYASNAQNGDEVLAEGRSAISSFCILLNGLHERSACHCISWLHSFVTNSGSHNVVKRAMAWDFVRTRPLLLCVCLMHAAAMRLVSMRPPQPYLA